MQTWLSVLVLAVFVAFGAGCRSTTGTTFGQNWDDTGITGTVKRKLAADTTSTLTRVSVTTVKGNVSLTGVVPTTADRARAEEIARSVDGVQQVTNNLQTEK
jgi:hyperosmotically inducible periplasmic protein